MKTLALLAFAALSNTVTAADLPPAPRPERVVAAGTVISARDPRLHIEVPRRSTYLGAERWNLYGVADCEIHVFVQAGRDKVVRNLYWIQFEGYLPHLPYNHYDYSKDEARRIQGLDFRVRARFGPTSEPPKPDSDRARVQQMIERAGYTLPRDMMNVRLVHLLPDARRELMVIYAEDLAPTGHTSADLRSGDTVSPAWPALQEALITRATRRVRFL